MSNKRAGARGKSPNRPVIDECSGHLERSLLPVLAIALLALLAYANSFQASFHFDDDASIVDNPVIHSLGRFLISGDGYAYNPRRVIGYLSFALNYHFGRLDVTGYHVVNLAIHLANGLLLFGLVRLTFATPLMRRSVLAPRRGQLALLAALLFVAHPVQSQAVTYIVQRLTSLAAFFYLGALVLHVRWRLAREAGSPLAGRKVLLPWLLSLAAAAAAMKTKEIAFTLPFAVLLYEVCFFGRPDTRRLLLLAPMLLTATIIPLSMLDIQKPLGGILSDVSKVTMVETTLPRGEYLSTQFSVVATYLRLLFLPINQNLDYDYPISRSPLEPRAFLSFLFLVAVLGAGIYLLRRSRGGDAGLRLAAFGIFWFFLTLAVESSVIPIVDVIFEHRVYLPSLGIFMAFVCVAALGAEAIAARAPRAAKFVLPALAAAALLLAGATYARNEVWQNEGTLWRDTVRKSPDKGRPNYSLGTFLSRSGSYEEAVRYLRHSIAVRPSYVEAYNNLGITYERMGERDAAVSLYQTALRLEPHHPESLHNLAHLFLESFNRPDLAEPLLLQAIAVKPDYVDAYVNLGAAYLKMGRPHQVIRWSTAGVRMAPDRAEIRLNLGVALAMAGDTGAAAKEAEALAALNPAMATQLRDFMVRLRKETAPRDRRDK